MHFSLVDSVFVCLVVLKTNKFFVLKQHAAVLKQQHENQTVENYIYPVVPGALDHASKSSQNELPADLPLWDSSKQTSMLYQ